jgi:hypothetical protein
VVVKSTQYQFVVGFPSFFPFSFFTPFSFVGDSVFFGGAHTPQVPPSLAQCLQPEQFLQAVQLAVPGQPRPPALMDGVAKMVNTMRVKTRMMIFMVNSPFVFI